MKFFLVLLLLCGLTYGGYIYYHQSKSNNVYSSISAESLNKPKLVMTKDSSKLSDLASVLGASITSTFENGKEMLSNATNGASEPIINELVNKTTETLKDLPRREAEKIKYEFCKGVVTEYENKSTQN